MNEDAMMIKRIAYLCALNRPQFTLKMGEKIACVVCITATVCCSFNGQILYNLVKLQVGFFIFLSVLQTEVV